MDFNMAFLGGRLSRDVELRYLPRSKHAIARTSIANSVHWETKSGRKQDKTSFISIEARGELAKRLHIECEKGDTILVEGRMETGTYESDRGTIWYFKIVAKDFQCVRKRRPASHCST